jgi:alkylhydroperoxidase/carboxymuconolactone decarboxylase family protein YurZ
MESETFEAGMRMRRQVHGAAHVDRAWDRAGADPYEAALQRLLTETAWGHCWSRDTLPPRERSLLVIAFLSTLGREHELATHVRSALLRTGCTTAEVKEVVLMAAAYAGIPAAVDAMAVVRRVEEQLATETGR